MTSKSSYFFSSTPKIYASKILFLKPSLSEVVKSFESNPQVPNGVLCHPGYQCFKHLASNTLFFRPRQPDAVNGAYQQPSFLNILCHYQGYSKVRYCDPGPSSAPDYIPGPSSAPDYSPGPSSAPDYSPGPSSAPDYSPGPSSASVCIPGPSSASDKAQVPSDPYECIPGPSNAPDYYPGPSNSDNCSPSSSDTQFFAPGPTNALSHQPRKEDRNNQEGHIDDKIDKTDDEKSSVAESHRSVDYCLHYLQLYYTNKPGKRKVVRDFDFKCQDAKKVKRDYKDEAKVPKKCLKSGATCVRLVKASNGRFRQKPDRTLCCNKVFLSINNVAIVQTEYKEPVSSFNEGRFDNWVNQMHQSRQLQLHNPIRYCKLVRSVEIPQAILDAKAFFPTVDLKNISLKDLKMLYLQRQRELCNYKPLQRCRKEK